MHTLMDVEVKLRERIVEVISATLLFASLGLLAFSGCSPSAETGAQKSVGMNFDLGQCQQMDAHLYKCPAVDKPLCDPDFARADVTCVRIDKNGSVILER